MSSYENLITITGGTKGIGRSIAEYYLSKGWHVVVGSRKNSSDKKFKHPNLKFKKIDVKIERDHEEFFKFALKQKKNFICAINCAGFSEWKPINKVTEKFWNQMINTNLKGTFLGCKIASKNLSKGGSIINISSLAGKRGSSNNSVYCASKFGVNGLTQALAKELGSKKIRVNAVCPVYINTPGLKKALMNKNSPSKGIKIENFFEGFSKSDTALKFLPSSQDVAQLCFFLSSNESSSITGQCINIDCGVMPQ